MGLTTAMQINPQLFEEYEVTAVPTFVLQGDQVWQKIAGHTSLENVLELFASEDEERAKKLLRNLKQQ